MSVLATATPADDTTILVGAGAAGAGWSAGSADPRQGRSARCPRRSNLLAGVALAAVLSGCIGPARTADDYTRKASTSLQDTRSAVETARLAVDAVARDRATDPYLSVLFGQAEEQATSVQSTFDSVQPPDRQADRLRDQVDGLLGEAVSVLGDLRIAARRGDTDGITGDGAALEDLSGRLSQLEDGLG